MLMTHLSRSLGALALAGALLIAGCATPPPPPPKVTLAVTQTDRGVMIWLPDNVLFEFGKSSLDLAAAAPYLDRVAQLLKEKATGNILLEGHTDNVGSANFNQNLSLKRAEIVRDALLERGIPKDRMQTAGAGLSKPLAPNDTETGRKLNRRVEIIMLGETVEHLKKGEPEGAFEEAFDRLKRLLYPDAEKS